MIVWGLFLALIFIFLALDLGVFNKNPHVISSKEAGIWTGVWVTLSFAFSGVVNWLYGNKFIENPTGIKPSEATIKYITGYLIELSLSVDNIFIIAVIFASFKISRKYQHRVLFWGILGAIVFRGLMIYFGVILINKFSWMTYLFGAFLLFTAVKMLAKKDEEDFDPKGSLIYRIIGRIIPITTHTEKENFFTKIDNVNHATPLFVALLVIEVMDMLFALDSVPAILAITSDPFLVFSSNIFAILGLRSMYFFLANMLEKFNHLEYSLIAILSFVGIKMLIVDYYKFPEWVSLSFIALSLIVGIVVSILKAPEKKSPDEEI
ncbi:TerC family protein [Flavobacterium wongokense]|uniref:TerC family protein n=1 Tax=Flavobacterium wongokense TaxID=2910674 RepID=UPI001F2322AB|nr:TerC family protein [Flavobacterium sp. WG47]MCF6130747.1 TerC family protein [Flavobacterium sp. WG47]